MSIITLFSSSFKGIAMSSPGTIDVHTGMIYHGGSSPFLYEVNLPKLIQNRYGKEVSIENDGKCAALAELWLGSVRNVEKSIVLVLGTAANEQHRENPNSKPKRLLNSF
ncbi:ROK family protein [Paenibacillus amylolyticus]|uniref:ROK family protein n=1 Tax=Paenibacillus amylolyticus TaxID=1451 RepID=UPI003EBA46D1